MESQYLFVYGWLKQKFHRSLPFDMPKTYLGKAYTFGELYHVADYPGIKLCGKQKTYGEVYKIPLNYDWQDMDQFEEALPLILHNPEYQRIKTTCWLNHAPIDCWIYEYLGKTEPSKLIKSGEF